VPTPVMPTPQATSSPIKDVLTLIFWLLARLVAQVLIQFIEGPGGHRGKSKLSSKFVSP
jgi:hypothetical protein